MIERRHHSADRAEASAPSPAEYFVMCPQCNAVLAVPEAALGRRRRCPVCRTGFAIPGAREGLRRVPEGFEPRLTGAAEKFRERRGIADRSFQIPGSSARPAKDANAGAPDVAPLRADQPLPSAHTVTVLVVDDSRSVRETAVFILDGAGYRTHTVANGPDALAWVARMTPGLVVIDTLLPGIDGYEVCRRMRAVSELRDIPIVMLGGDNAMICRLHARMAGATTGLPKPCAADTLLATLEEIRRR